MPDLDSLSFALLIPFSVCFVMLFLVCCFADKIKQILCLPNRLPPQYSGRHEYGRMRPNRSSRHIRSRNYVIEENRILIDSEGRTRNISESSAESNDASSMYADVYSRMGVLPAYILISTPLNHPRNVNRTLNPVAVHNLNSSNHLRTDSTLQRPEIVVIQR